VVKVYLPRVDERPALVTRKSLSRNLNGGETILLVEDDSLVRAGAIRILKGHGYKVLDACNGANALATVDAHAGKVDLVLSDVIMPGVNGPDLVEQLRRRFPEIKALFMSGYTDHAVLANGALQAGVNFLQKPFVPEVLAKRVRAALDASPMNAEVPSSVAQLARV
jgi:CheY-like chemotaxis protein